MAELPTQRDFEDFSAWTGRDVLGPGGDRLGAVEVIFLDEATDRPEWVLVRLEDGDGAAFVPLAGAAVEERSIRVEQDRETIAAAPRFDVDDTLTVAEERRLYEHYGLAYSQEESATVLPEGAGGESGASQPTEPRPRLRRFVGAPVPPAAAADDQPSPAPSPAAEGDAPRDAPRTTGTGAAGPDAGAPPTPIPPPAPKPIPPEGGFQAAEEPAAGDGGPLAALRRKPAIPVVLGGALAALIAVLALRRRR